MSRFMSFYFLWLLIYSIYNQAMLYFVKSMDSTQNTSCDDDLEKKINSPLQSFLCFTVSTNSIDVCRLLRKLIRFEDCSICARLSEAKQHELCRFFCWAMGSGWLLMFCVRDLIGTNFYSPSGGNGRFFPDLCCLMERF